MANASDHLRPLVCVPASFIELSPHRYRAHVTGQSCVDSLERYAQCVPIILPALGDRLELELEQLVPRIDGLMLTGGRANVEPHHYGGPPFPDDEVIDPGRDTTVLRLIRACVKSCVPVFGICRGIQEMNVALGGTLHYRVHLAPDKEDHRMPQKEDLTTEEVFELRHPVRLTAGGLFSELVGESEVMVNSLHGQGIDRLADALEIEATSPDGLIEGVRLKDDRTFTVGVQWHAEWKPEEHALSRALFGEFGRAAHAHARDRQETLAPSRAQSAAVAAS